MRVGLVCPYSLDVPGGVQNHVLGLADSLAALGHEVSVLAPGHSAGVPAYVVTTGAALPLPYNGAVARMAFGPRSAARTRRWLAEGRFDVLHLHEPTTPSLSLLALWAANCPVVATFHAAHGRARLLALTAPLQRRWLAGVGSRVAVSEQARATHRDHLGSDPVVVSNGLSVDRLARVGRSGPRVATSDGTEQTVVFVGRLAEPRKGFGVLARAFAEVASVRPWLRLDVVGAGDLGRAVASVPAPARGRVRFLGPLPDDGRAAAVGRADVFVAPHTGGESFGMVVAEAMAAGVPVLASDLPAFRQLLDDGALGALFRTGDPADLADELAALLDDHARRRVLAKRAAEEVRRYDWEAVTPRLLRLYDEARRGRPQALAVVD